MKNKTAFSSEKRRVYVAWNVLAYLADKGSLSVTKMRHCDIPNLFVDYTLKPPEWFRDVNDVEQCLAAYVVLKKKYDGGG